MAFRRWLLGSAILALAAPCAMAQPPQNGVQQPPGRPAQATPEAARQHPDLGAARRQQVTPPVTRPSVQAPAERPGHGPVGPSMASPPQGASGVRQQLEHRFRQGVPGGANVVAPQMHPPAPPAAGQPGPGAGREHHRGAPSFEGRRAPNMPRLGDWNRNLRGPDQDLAGRQWRRQHHDWDQGARWRQNRDWWRHDRAFRLFVGPRLGFLFVPELGYIQTPPEYLHGYWAPGGYLPAWFWRFQVRDYERYGLPDPPPGCVWVWVNDDIALIDASNGYILDMVRNVW